MRGGEGGREGRREKREEGRKEIGGKVEGMGLGKKSWPSLLLFLAG